MRIAVAGGTGLVGRHVVEAARAGGHDVVVIARSAGVNTITGEGLAAALTGVEAIVDATNPPTTDDAESIAFFTSSVANLHQHGAACGVRRLVVLSIVGIDGAREGHYAAKLAQENAAIAGPVPVTILRTTQFHEFAAQMIVWNRSDDVARIPDMHVQPVAARAVGSVLAELAVADTAPVRAAEVAGPEHARLADLSRRVVDHFNLGVRIEPVAAGLPDDALVPHGEARIDGPTFDAWLTSADAAGIAAQV